MVKEITGKGQGSPHTSLVCFEQSLLSQGLSLFCICLVGSQREQHASDVQSILESIMNTLTLCADHKEHVKRRLGAWKSFDLYCHQFFMSIASGAGRAKVRCRGSDGVVW